MARCWNCIHFDVCNHDRREYEETFGQCREFFNEDDVISRNEIEKLFDEIESCVIGTLEPSFQELRKKYRRKITNEN